MIKEAEPGLPANPPKAAAGGVSLMFSPDVIPSEAMDLQW